MSNTQTTTYIIDLEGAGRVFQHSLRSIGVSNPYMHNTVELISELDFIYKESITQMVLILDGNVNQYLFKLMHLPDMSFFNHLNHFQDPNKLKIYTDAYRTFAYSLLMILNKHLIIRIEADYLLEGITADYIVINEHLKL